MGGAVQGARPSSLGPVPRRLPSSVGWARAPPFPKILHVGCYGALPYFATGQCIVPIGCLSATGALQVVGVTETRCGVHLEDTETGAPCTPRGPCTDYMYPGDTRPCPHVAAAFLPSACTPMSPTYLYISRCAAPPPLYPRNAGPATASWQPLPTWAIPSAAAAENPTAAGAGRGAGDRLKAVDPAALCCPLLPPAAPCCPLPVVLQA
eukprot:gene1775-2914_t